MFLNAKDYTATLGEDTAREILQQPGVWMKIADILKSNKLEITNFMDRANENKNLRVSFTGAGSSAFCAEVLAATCNNSLRIVSDAPHTTDIVTNPYSVLNADIPTLLVSFGRSGNSPESIGAVEYARKVVSNLYEIAITCAKDGKLASITGNSDKRMTILLPDESCDLGFAMTSSLTGMALAAFGVMSYKNLDAFISDINLLANSVEINIQKYADFASKLVESRSFDRVAYLGCGCLKGCAHEATVKMSELSAGQVNVVHDSSTGFRHGPKSMVNDNTITVHFLSYDNFARKYDMDLLNEMIREKKNNTLVALSTENLAIDGVDHLLALGNEKYNVAGEFYNGIKGLVFCQLFAFYTSQKLGITTDNPCPTGEVNRVVSGVTIYPL